MIINVLGIEEDRLAEEQRWADFFYSNHDISRSLQDAFEMVWISELFPPITLNLDPIVTIDYCVDPSFRLTYE